MLFAYVVMADVVTCRLMELSTVGVGGRWNGHWVNALVLILLFCVKPHPICVADGICQYFYWGMGHWPLWTDQHCDTILWWKMPGVNISSDLEEAMFETGKSLSVYS